MFLSVIKHNKAGMAAILIVCGISFLLVGLFAHALHENGEDLNKIKAFSNKHAYVLVDSTPEIEMQRILTQKNASELLSEFFQSLYEDGIFARITAMICIRTRTAILCTTIPQADHFLSYTA